MEEGRGNGWGHNELSLADLRFEVLESWMCVLDKGQGKDSIFQPRDNKDSLTSGRQELAEDQE